MQNSDISSHKGGGGGGGNYVTKAKSSVIVH